MRAFGIFVLICIAAVLTTARADGTCDKIETREGLLETTIKVCYMKSTAIDSKDFSITSDRDVTVEGFSAFRNNKFEYLPNNLGGKFPNLLGLWAESCPIKEVSKDNFEGLSKLRYLFLSANKLVKIDDDTFEHIPAVEIIWLSNNKIKKINGRAFASLHKLTRVDLNSNECIDEMFIGAARIVEMPRIVTEKCGFNESEPSSTNIV